VRLPTSQCLIDEKTSFLLKASLIQC
jgi:hypothetical protein